MTILEVKDLCKKYPAFTLDKVSFSVEQGEIVGFIGRNGAGKTTTLKCMQSIVHPNSGEISYFGMPFEQNQQLIKQKVGFVSGGVRYYPTKKIKTIAEVTKRFYDDWQQDLYTKYLKMFNLDENKTPSQLSEGMKVKFALTLALSHNAQLLLLDEPTSGLDPISRDEILDIFITLCKEGKSILFSTHITSDLDKCADRILYIKQGKIICDNKLEEFVGKYKLVSVSEAQAEAYKDVLIGAKPGKKGCSALVYANAKLPSDITTEVANLDDIMIHLEKE